MFQANPQLSVSPSLTVNPALALDPSIVVNPSVSLETFTNLTLDQTLTTRVYFSGIPFVDTLSSQNTGLSTLSLGSAISISQRNTTPFYSSSTTDTLASSSTNPEHIYSRELEDRKAAQLECDQKVNNSISDAQSGSSTPEFIVTSQRSLLESPLSTKSDISVDSERLSATFDSLTLEELQSASSQLLIPAGYGPGVLTFGNQGINLSQQVTSLVRHELQSGSNSVILEKSIVESKVIKAKAVLDLFGEIDKQISNKTPSLNQVIQHTTQPLREEVVYMQSSSSLTSNFKIPLFIRETEQIHRTGALRTPHPLPTGTYFLGSGFYNRSAVSNQSRRLDLNVTTLAKKKTSQGDLESFLNKLSIQDKADFTVVVNNIIANIPKNSMDIIDLDRQDDLKATLFQMDLSTLREIEKMQVFTNESFEKLFSDSDLLRDTQRELENDKDIIARSQLLDYDAKNMRELENALCLLYAKGIKFPYLLGCSLPFLVLERFRTWFDDKKGKEKLQSKNRHQVFTNLKKIEKSLNKDNSLPTISVQELEDKYGEPFVNIKQSFVHNVKMLIVVAEFFVELIKNPQIKFAKDHALIQSLSRVVVRDNYTRDVIGRNASQYDPESAYISSESANIVRTQSFNSYYSPYVPVRSGVEGIIRNMNVISLTNPKYLSIILKTPGLCKFETFSNKKVNLFLRSNIDAAILSEYRVTEFIKRFEIKDNFVELVFFEFLIAFDNATMQLYRLVHFGYQTDQSIIDQLEDFAKYKNCIELLISLYCLKENSKKILEQLKSEWESFLLILPDRMNFEREKLSEYTELADNFKDQLLSWKCFKNFVDLCKEIEDSDLLTVPWFQLYFIDSFSFIKSNSQKLAGQGQLPLEELKGKLLPMLQEMEAASKEFDKMEKDFPIESLLTKDQKDLFNKLKMVLKSVLEQFKKHAYVTQDIYYFFYEERSTRYINNFASNEKIKRSLQKATEPKGPERAFP
jgi:hypothetical protein